MSDSAQIIERPQGAGAPPPPLAHEQTVPAAAASAQQRLAFLVEASRVLAESLDYPTTCLQPLVIHDLGLTIRQVLGRRMAHKGVV